MSKSDVPLLDWQPPCHFIPFPALARTGHAKRVAQQLATARTNREASFRLQRAIITFEDQLMAIGISGFDLECERHAYLVVIHQQCSEIGTTYGPVIPPAPTQIQSDPAGGAA